MSKARERPRLVVARTLALALLVGLGVAIGTWLDDPPEVPPRAEAQLERAQFVSGERADRLDRTGAELQRLQAELEDAEAQARSLARANSRLRRDVREAKRGLRRKQRARRSRSR